MMDIKNIPIFRCFFKKTSTVDSVFLKKEFVSFISSARYNEIMELNSEIITLLISILAVIISLFALIISYKKYRRDKPILSVTPYISSYSIHEQEFPKLNLLKITASFLINNSGDISTSITASSSRIRYLPDSSVMQLMFKHKGTLAMANPNDLPTEVKANCTTTITLHYTLEYDNILALDSCVRPSFIERKKDALVVKQERDDIILHVGFNFATTHNQILETYGCIFRDDQPESKNADRDNRGLLRSSLALAQKRNDDLIIT